jgi:hypothetical protein
MNESRSLCDIQELKKHAMSKKQVAPLNARTWWLSVVLLSACPRQAHVELIDASVSEVDAGVDAGFDAGALPLEFSIELETVDGGSLAGLDAGVTVDPLRAITLTFPVALDDVRFRVMDWNDAVVPSDDESSADGGLTYRIVFVQPLKSGRTYSLLIDAETKDTFADDRGHEYTERRIPFRVSGHPQAEPGSPSKRRKKKR